MPAATIRCRRRAARRAGCRASTRARTCSSRSATSPGEVALDGAGRNSPYTKHLKDAIGTPNLTIEDTFKRTLKGVYQETGGKQQPWISSSFFGEFMFRPGAPPVAGALRPPPAAAGGRSSIPRDDARRRGAPARARARRPLSRGRHQSERQPLPRHGRADARGQISTASPGGSDGSRFSPASASLPGACWW